MENFNLLFLIDIESTSPFGTFLTFVYLFMIGSMIGYVIEVFFRRFFSMKKWINPGFLKGPYLPLYGFGTCVLYLLSHLSLKYFVLESTIPSFYNSSLETYGSYNFFIVGVITILIIGLAMTILEYIAGLIFIKGLHIRLWDYSKMKGNVQGLICPLFSLLWLICGALYFFLIHPFIYKLVDFLNVHLWGITFVLGAFFAIFILDLINSLILSIKVSKLAKLEEKIVDFEKMKLNLKTKKIKNSRFEQLKESLLEASLPVRKKIDDIVLNTKKHLYIDNKIPDKNSQNLSETPRTKKEEENKNDS